MISLPIGGVNIVFANAINKHICLDCIAKKDDQINELYSSGFSFQHKTLEEYVNESGGEFILSERIDWGEPVGREIW